MKILLLNPYIDASHDVVRVLQKKGVAVLLSPDPTEAWQMLLLHGTTVDLVVVHREGTGGTGEPGFKFIAQLKADPLQADLPFVITSEKWNDEKFAAHQEGSQGANAYLKFPFSAQDLLCLVDGILGQEGSKPFESAEPPPSTPKGKLEDASVIFNQAESGGSESSSEGKIRLDAPEVPKESAAEAKQTAESEKELPSEKEPPPEEELPPIVLKPAAPELPPPAAAEAEEPLEIHDAGAEQEMPYLYSGTGFTTPREAEAREEGMRFSQPVGDAVVPGGAVQSPDLETLKKYLLLREQDVAALSSQLKSAREQLAALEDLLRQERAKNIELGHTVEEQKRKLADFEKDKSVEIEILQNDINELRFQMKVKADKARILEAKVREATEETERLKDRVRGDIRKIRVHEKELENRLEIMKRDSEALIGARENKIIELKRKLDLLEFNMDLLQDQQQREKESMALTRERLLKASQAVRVASRILDGSAPSLEEAGSLSEESSALEAIKEKEKAAS